MLGFHSGWCVATSLPAIRPCFQATGERQTMPFTLDAQSQKIQGPSWGNGHRGLLTARPLSHQGSSSLAIWPPSTENNGMDGG